MKRTFGNIDDITFAEKSSVRNKDIMKELNKILNEDNYLRDSSGWFEFVGFNPKMVRSHFFQCNKDAPDPEKTTVTDVVTLILFYSTRGTKIVKAMKKMSKQGKTLLQTYKDKYSIYENVAGNANTVTMSRMISAFPEETSSIMKCSGAQHNFKLYPSFMCFPAFASLIPKDDDKYEYMIELHRSWCKEFDERVGRQQARLERRHYIEWNDSYWWVAHNSDAIPPNRRVACLERCMEIKRKWDVRNCINLDGQEIEARARAHSAWKTILEWYIKVLIEHKDFQFTWFGQSQYVYEQFIAEVEDDNSAAEDYVESSSTTTDDSDEEQDPQVDKAALPPHYLR